MSDLWAVHVEGPDDILAAPSREAAEVKAAEINDIARMLRERPTASELDAHIHATVVPWPFPPAEHAAAITDEEYTP